MRARFGSGLQMNTCVGRPITVVVPGMKKKTLADEKRARVFRFSREPIWLIRLMRLTR
jgi:hypothetical protein